MTECAVALKTDQQYKYDVIKDTDERPQTSHRSLIDRVAAEDGMFPWSLVGGFYRSSRKGARDRETESATRRKTGWSASAKRFRFLRGCMV